MENITTIKVIPKKTILPVDIKTGLPIKRRVAAYARVSTDLEDQKNSFNAQLEEYGSRISKNPEWEFVKLYSDEGISGTSIKHRSGFKKMIKDALEGKIDLILVKSISRFARNTVDCLKTVRELRKKNVEVFFDKENISTNDTKVDVMLTIYASFAQEESKSISENVKWGVRKRMAKGQRKMNVATTLGYTSDDEGNVIIDESTKGIVIKIFNLYAAGYTLRQIAEVMTSQGYKTGTGKDIWKVHDVNVIISNEKYVGDFIMQKTCVVDYLEHKTVVNNGIEEKYVFSNHHEAIIDRKKFNEIQIIKRGRFLSNSNNTPTSNYLNGIFFCEHCLRKMKLITVHPKTNYARKVFTCKITAKMSPNYVNCDSLSTIDYLLVNKAVSDILARFYKSSLTLDTSINETYCTAVKELVNKIEEYKKLITECESKMTTLVKLQLEEKEINKYQSEFSILKKNVSAYKDEITKLEEAIGSENKKLIIQSKINNYLQSGILSYEVVKNFIRGAIRRKDGSLRFIIGDNPIVINEETINKLLNEVASFSSCVTGDYGTLQFDVIKAGGNNNGI